MEFLGSLQGQSIVRVSPEDVVPRNGIPWPDVVTALSGRYKFSLASAPPPAAPTQLAPWLTLQSGEFDSRSGKVAIQQLFLTQGGAVVITATTEASDAILEDLIAFLDRSFEFRFSKAKQKRNHISEVVVQFSRGIEDYILGISRFEGIVSDAIAKDGMPGARAKIKRLTLGREGFDASEIVVGAGNPLDWVDATEFIIERRIKHPYSENRYFSRAPLETSAHVAALEAFESSLATR